MSTRFRFVVALVTILLIGIPAVALTLAEPPESGRRTLELPSDFSPPINRGNPERDPKVQQRLREAIESGNFEETGDAAFDDMLQVIKRRRSILAGSPLDPAAAGLDSGKQRDKSVSAKAHAAECLLKAARILEKIEPTDKSRRDLVNQMRGESVRLLTQ